MNHGEAPTRRQKREARAHPGPDSPLPQNMGLRPSIMWRCAHSALLMKRRVCQERAGACVGQSSALAGCCGQQIAAQNAHTVAQSVGGDVILRQPQKFRLPLQKAHLCVAHAKGNREPYCAHPGSRIDDQVTGVGKAGRQQHGVGADPVAARRLAENKPPAEQPGVCAGEVTHA